MKPTPKREMLRRTGTLNPRPDRVTDEGFAHSDYQAQSLVTPGWEET